jgi:hypothetical protein
MGITVRLRGLSGRSGCGAIAVGGRSLSSSLWTFYLQNARFYSGGTRIRTGDTMIFSHVLYQLSYPADEAAA